MEQMYRGHTAQTSHHQSHCIDWLYCVIARKICQTSSNCIPFGFNFQHSMNVHCCSSWTLFHIITFFIISCETEANCKRTDNGAEYRGHIDLTEHQQHCIDWSYFPSDMLPGTLNVSQHENYCRAGPDDASPWCWFSNQGIIDYDYCNIDYCGKYSCGDHL